MICPTCKTFAYSAFCSGCGLPKSEFVEYKCECGNSLGVYQKFCDKCGLKTPGPPTYTIMDKVRDEAVNE